MRIKFVTCKFRNVERNSHCDVQHFTHVRVARLVLDCNGVFVIKAYGKRGKMKCLAELNVVENPDGKAEGEDLVATYRGLPSDDLPASVR